MIGQENKLNKPVTAIIVGAGHRAEVYARYSEHYPERLKVVGVADPNELRRKQIARKYNLTENQCFKSAEELANKGKLADAIINGTMDSQHVPTCLVLLQSGYDILLEKPFAIFEEQVWQLAQAVREYKRKVMICHVLRYAPFYVEIKKHILNGEIGEIISIQTAEHVSYHHVACCFVRGKWNRQDVCGSSALMSKCCHDLDIIMWMNSGINPIKVSSFGGLHYFREEKAPKNAGEYCLLDCPIEQECLYSARKHYLNHPDRWAFYVWAGLEHLENPTLKDKEEYLKRKDHLYGKCVWKCDNTVVDRQAVLIEFENGSIATHNMICGTSRPMRKIHIVGTEGEIQGIMDDSVYTIRHIDTRPGHEYKEIIHDLNLRGDMTGAFGGHGGGDLRLVEDFVNVLQGEKPSISCTSLEDSINGHLVGFAADRARTENRVIEIKRC